jgi:hypothetical protein
LKSLEKLTFFLYTNHDISETLDYVKCTLVQAVRPIGGVEV